MAFVQTQPTNFSLKADHQGSLVPRFLPGAGLTCLCHSLGLCQALLRRPCQVLWAVWQDHDHTAMIRIAKILDHWVTRGLAGTIPYQRISENSTSQVSGLNPKDHIPSPVRTPPRFPTDYKGLPAMSFLRISTGER